MEETRQFLFDLVREFNVNIGGAVPERPLQARLIKASPVIKNNFEATINQLIDEDIFTLKEGHNNVLFLTEHGFQVIYG